VVVPLGSRIVTGIVVDAPAPSNGDLNDVAIKPIRECSTPARSIPPDVVDLAIWTAECTRPVPVKRLPLFCRPRRAAGGRMHTRRYASPRSRLRGWTCDRRLTLKERPVLRQVRDDVS
jgi:hypothetical protein